MSVQGEKGKFHLKMTATADGVFLFFFFLPGFGTFDNRELERVDKLFFKREKFQ